MYNNILKKIILILNKKISLYNVPLVDLVKVETNDPFKILVTTILSARSKDEITYKVSYRLFKIADNPLSLSKITIKKLEKILYPVVYYKNKSKYLHEMSLQLIKEYNSKVPDKYENLIKLKGVGRKTANLVLSLAFNKYAICVDTHVHTIMNRLFDIKTKTPYETEVYLMSNLDKKYWKLVNKLFVILGQSICTPISPKCSICPINKYCLKNNVNKHR